MRKISYIFGIVFTIFLFGCNQKAEDQNPFKGMTFSKINEIPQLKDFEYQAGSLIDAGGKPGDGYDYGIGQYFSKGKYLLTLEKVIPQRGSPNPLNEIIDTIMIPGLEKNQTISLHTCRLNGNDDTEIIAVLDDCDSENEYNTKIVKAWRADTRTGKIILISDVSKIDCLNDDYAGFD